MKEINLKVYKQKWQITKKNFASKLKNESATAAAYLRHVI